MSSSIFVTLPKKAKAIECSDYRTLSLMSRNWNTTEDDSQTKKKKIEYVISETQSDFMVGKGTREGIYNIRTIIERHVNLGKNI